MAVDPSAGRTSRRPYAARMPAAQRREQLLDAAIEIVVRDGYDKVSIDAIAREADVTRPVVYGAFDGLGPLLSALLDRQQERAVAQIAEAIPAAPDLSEPDRFLIGAARLLLQKVSDDPLTWRPILYAGHGTPPAVQERIEADRERIRRQFAGLLSVGLPLRGGPSLDTEVVSHALVAIFEHFGRLALEDPPRFEIDRLVATVRDLLASLHG